MCSSVTWIAMTAWSTLVGMTMMGMSTVSMKFLLSTHLPLLWTHLLCTAKLRRTVHHQWIMSTQNPQRSVSGNILHSQSKRHGITATLHGTTSHWWRSAILSELLVLFTRLANSAVQGLLRLLEYYRLGQKRDHGRYHQISMLWDTVQMRTPTLLHNWERYVWQYLRGPTTSITAVGAVTNT